MSGSLSRGLLAVRFKSERRSPRGRWASWRSAPPCSSRPCVAHSYVFGVAVLGYRAENVETFQSELSQYGNVRRCKFDWIRNFLNLPNWDIARDCWISTLSERSNECELILVAFSNRKSKTSTIYSHHQNWKLSWWFGSRFAYACFWQKIDLAFHVRNRIDSVSLYRRKLCQEAWSKALLNEAFGSRINLTCESPRRRSRKPRSELKAWKEKSTCVRKSCPDQENKRKTSNLQIRGWTHLKTRKSGADGGS